VRDHLLGAVVAERQQRATVRHHRPRPPCAGDEAVGADVHGREEVVQAGVDELAAKLVLVGKADSVDEEIDRRPAPAKRCERRVEFRHVADVAIDQQVGADAFGERPHALLECLAEIAERQLGALVGQRLRNAPRQRAIVGDAHDEAALARHQSRHAFSLSLVPPARRSFAHFAAPALAPR
jgi:hypothetical protein